MDLEKEGRQEVVINQSENQFRKSNLVLLNLIIKRSDITKPSYNKVNLLVQALYISLVFYPDITRNLL